MNTDENCDTCGGPCVYREGHAEPAPDDVGVTVMACWVEPEKPADD